MMAKWVWVALGFALLGCSKLVGPVVDDDASADSAAEETDVTVTDGAVDTADGETTDDALTPGDEATADAASLEDAVSLSDGDTGDVAVTADLAEDVTEVASVDSEQDETTGPDSK